MNTENCYRVDEVADAFEKFVKENPKDGILSVAFNMASFYFQQNKKEKAKTITVPAIGYSARFCPGCNNEISLNGYYCCWCGKRID